MKALAVLLIALGAAACSEPVPQARKFGPPTGRDTTAWSNAPFNRDEDAWKRATADRANAAYQYDAPR